MRKLVAIALFLAWLLIYIIGVASLSSPINAWPRWVQLAFYITAGIAWIFPLRSLFRWMNRGPESSGNS
ncbi:MAG: DUF2842 domain-containing protein [Pseudomonadota bacterium]